MNNDTEIAKDLDPVTEFNKEAFKLALVAAIDKRTMLLKRNEVAKRLGIHATRLSKLTNLEEVTALPTVEELFNLNREFGISLDELFNRNQPLPRVDFAVQEQNRLFVETVTRTSLLQTDLIQRLTSALGSQIQASANNITQEIASKGYSPSEEFIAKTQIERLERYSNKVIIITRRLDNIVNLQTPNDFMRVEMFNCADRDVDYTWIVSNDHPLDIEDKYRHTLLNFFPQLNNTKHITASQYKEKVWKSVEVIRVDVHPIVTVAFHRVDTRELSEAEPVLYARLRRWLHNVPDNPNYWLGHVAAPLEESSYFILLDKDHVQFGIEQIKHFGIEPIKRLRTGIGRSRRHVRGSKPRA